MKKGAADKSYGIHVAKLAGLPNELLSRADVILSDLENNNEKTNTDNVVMAEKSSPVVEDENDEPEQQLSLFGDVKEPQKKKRKSGEDKILKALKDLDLMSKTPMDIMNEVYKWKREIDK